MGQKSLHASSVHHLSDVWAAKEGSDCPRFFQGIPIKKKVAADGGSLYFVQWPKSTNGIAGGWYKGEDLLVM